MALPAMGKEPPGPGWFGLCLMLPGLWLRLESDGLLGDSNINYPVFLFLTMLLKTFQYRLAWNFNEAKRLSLHSTGEPVKSSCEWRGRWHKLMVVGLLG